MSSSSQKAKEKEVADPGPEAEDHSDDLTDEEDSDEELDAALPESSTPSTVSKKKKKKRSKAITALNTLRGKKEIPQELVDAVLAKVKAEQGDNAPGADEATVRAALEQMKIKDVIEGKAGIGGKNRKDTGGHKFWATQPVPQPGEDVSTDDGYIEPSQPREQVRQEPYPLPKDFVWSFLDINEPAQLRELYELLSANYVEDDDASFRFQYTAQFLEWALKPPGYVKEWHIGVRVASNKKLVAFVSAIPVTVRIRENIVRASEVNFLCVHKKLRSKRLAPVLIKEITRQCHLLGIFQAIYTGGVVIPTPVSTCRYYHRCLNIAKLVNVRFTHVPANMSLARMIRLHRLPERPRLFDRGLREMEEKDVADVAELYGRYMRRFGLTLVMTLDEVRHHFLSGQGSGPRNKDSYKTPREGQVVWTYVIEDPQTHKITDYFSFYCLPSTIINHPKHNLLNAAYLYYYGTDVAFQEGSQDDGRLKKRLHELITDALIIAGESNFDVFNGLSLMDNGEFLADLKFGLGDGLLNYYLYNWRTAPLAGMTSVDGVPVGRGIGVVML